MSVSGMQHAEHVAVVTAESARLADAARAAGSDVPVASCPGWDVAQLVRHTGTTHRWAHAVLERAGPVDPRGVPLGLPDERDAYPEWLERGAAELVAAFGDSDPNEPIWVWGTDQHVRFWSRRMAHETVVHRWDALHAAGGPEPIDPGLAVDGIDELFENAPRHPVLTQITGAGETLHLHATDHDGEWLLRLEPDGLVVSREHAKGDVAVRGGASDLLLFALGRVRASALEVFGDEDLLDRWRRQMRF